MKTTSPEPATARAARAVLTYLAEPADVLLGGLLRVADPREIVAAIRSGTVPGGISRQLSPGQQARIGPGLAQWRMRLAAIPAGTGLGSLEARGVHLLCPGDPGWPGQLDDLGEARPYALWVRGTADLRDLCRWSVAVVGSRAATAYGTHICAEITAGLAAIRVGDRLRRCVRHRRHRPPRRPGLRRPHRGGARLRPGPRLPA